MDSENVEPDQATSQQLPEASGHQAGEGNSYPRYRNTSYVQPTRPRSGHLLENYEIELDGSIDYGEGRLHQFKLFDNQGELMLSQQDLLALGYEIDSLGDCAVKLNCQAYSHYLLGCRIQQQQEQGVLAQAPIPTL